MNPTLSVQKVAHLSPLVLADQMISLAQAADRAGYRSAASRLIVLAYAVLERRDPNGRPVRAGRSTAARARAA